MAALLTGLMFHQSIVLCLPDYAMVFFFFHSDYHLHKISDRGDAIVCPETVKRLNDTFN